MTLTRNRKFQKSVVAKENQGKKKSAQPLQNRTTNLPPPTFREIAMEFPMFGMPFGSSLAPLGQISTNTFYGAMPHQPVSSYYPGVVSYGMPLGSQPIIGIGASQYLPSIGSSQNSMFFTQQAKPMSTSSITSTEHIITRKNVDVRIEHPKDSKENIDSNAVVVGKPSEETLLRYFLRNMLFLSLAVM